MKKGIGLILLTLILSSCGSKAPQDEEIPFDNPTHEDIPGGEGEEEGGEDPTPIVPEVIKVSDFLLNDASLTIGLSSTYRLKYTVLPENADNRKINWTSDDSKICTINSNGVVTGIREGETTVRGVTTDGSNISSECTIKVQRISVSDVTLTSSSMSLFEGEEKTFSASVNPSDATNKFLEVVSLDTEVATVSKTSSTTYKVYAVKEGNTKIQVTSLDNTEIVRFVDVTVSPVKLQAISINSEVAYLNEESTFQLHINFVPTNASNKNLTFESADSSVASVDQNGLITGISKGATTITVTSEDGGFVKECQVNVEEKGKLIKQTLYYKEKDLFNNYTAKIDCAPSTGDVNLLVVPVWFTDSLTFIATQRVEVVRKDIEKAFVGTNEQTGWRSVKGYYEELSNGRLHLNPIVTEWYECGMSSSSFYEKTAGLNQTTSLVNSAAAWYKSKMHLDSLSDFDADKNGYIDGIVLIYACPDYGAWDKYSTGYQNLWAYTFWNTNNTPNVSQPTPNAFLWASYDFMYGKEMAASRTSKSDCGGGDTTNCSLDAHTYIHEMGHVFGLNDYYDYSNTYTASSGFSMQDFNIGSHDPYSCMKFGYADPYVVTGDQTITIGDFQSTRDIIMVTNNFSNSPFDEYFLVELYTPTGLNEFDSLAVYGGEDVYKPRPIGVNKPGIRLWHVDGRLAYASDSGTGYKYSSENVTTNPYIEGYQVCELMANSFNVEERETIYSLSDYSELFLVRNDINVTYMPSDSDWMFNEKCMFYQGDTFNINKFAKQFKKSKKGVEEALLNNGEEFRFNIKVESLSSDSATISITTY